MKAVLAIDPGPEKSAWVVWNGSEILGKGTQDNSELDIHTRDFPDWDFAVIEMIASYGMPVGQEVFDTCVWIGRFTEQIIQGCCSPDYLFRKEVKLHMCNSLRANDSNIRAALIDRFGRPGTKKAPGILYKVNNDERAALAVAITWWDKNSEDIRSRRAD